MARFDWEQLGREVQELVDKVSDPQQIQRLSQNIHQTVEGAVRRAADNFSQVSRSQDVRRLYGSTVPWTAKSVVKSVIGGVLSLLSATILLGAAISFEPVPADYALVAIFGTALVGGGCLIGSSVRTFQRLDRFRIYRRLLGDGTACSLELLAEGVDKSYQTVREDLRWLIAHGLFREGHLNKEQNYLLTSHETYRYFEQSRLQLEQRQRLEAQQRASRTVDRPVQEIVDRGQGFLRQLRRCNDRIPGEEISGKISKIELIVQRIFSRVEEHPEIVPDLKKLMEHYLPLTVKLLDAYADMDAQPVQGANIRKSKVEIESTLDTLIVAFERLLDELFSDTAMDVSTDISFLNALLAQEGLTGARIELTDKK